MPSKTVIVGSAIGLHARPAAIIAEAVVEAGVPVTLSMDGGEPVDAGSALMIMTLGAGNGAQVTVSSDDETAMNTIAELVQKDLDACLADTRDRGAFGAAGRHLPRSPAGKESGMTPP